MVDNYLLTWGQSNLLPLTRLVSTQLLLQVASNIFTVKTLSSEIWNLKIYLSLMTVILNSLTLDSQRFSIKEELSQFVELQNISLLKSFSIKVMEKQLIGGLWAYWFTKCMQESTHSMIKIRWVFTRIF